MGEGPGERGDWVICSHQRHFPGVSNLDTQAITGTKASAREGVHRDRHLVLGAHPSLATPACVLYLSFHE